MIREWALWLVGDGRPYVFLGLMTLFGSAMAYAWALQHYGHREPLLWHPPRPAQAEDDFETQMAAKMLELNQPLEAMQRYRGIVEQRPTDADALYNLGHAYFSLKQYGPARACWRAVRRLQPYEVDARINLRLAAKLMRIDEVSRAS